jgi:hypothetical protein
MMASPLRSLSWLTHSLVLPLTFIAVAACGGEDGEASSETDTTADTGMDAADAVDVTPPDTTPDTARPDAEREPHEVNGIEPTRGDIEGRTTIDIEGDNFPDLCSVRFGQLPSVPATTLSEELMVVNTPAAIEAGIVDVTIRCSGVDVVLADAFEYFAPIQPIVTDVSPLFGSVEGGELVTITGTALIPGQRNFVSFGGEIASDVEFVDEQTISVITPAQSPGQVTILVELGSQRASVQDPFTYLDALVVDAALPGFADARGGTEVQLLGQGLWPFAGIEIEVGGVAADSATIEYEDDGFSLTFVAPENELRGPVDVVVRSLLNEFTLEDALALIEPVSVSDVAPDALPTAAGQRVTLTGDGAAFDPDADPLQVLLNETEAFAVSWDSDTEISFLVPPLDAGEYTVTLLHGLQTLIADQPLTLFDTISVESITPANGDPEGGTRLEIVGSGFVDDALVFFGDAQGTSVAVASDGLSLSVTTPAGTGVVDVIVRTRFSFATLTDAFAFSD